MNKQQKKVITILNQIAEMEAAKEAHKLALQDERRKIIPEDLWNQLEQLEAEFAGKLEVADEKIAALKEEAKETLLSMPNPETIKGDYMSAQFRNGSIKWDDKGLVNLAADYPMLLRYRKVGPPTVAFVVNR